MTTKSKNLFLLLFLFLILISCGKKQAEKIEVDRFLFGTNLKIIVYSENRSKAETVIENTFKLMEEISEKYNSKNANSIVSKLNANPTEKTPIDEEFYEMIANTIKLSELTEGSFDITVGPLMSLWGFDDLDIKELPSEDAIVKAMEFVNYKDINLSKENISLEKVGQRIDTGSFLKGYAIQKGIDYLKAQGIENSMITAISSIGTIGEKPEGKPFKIGVQNPKNPEELIYTIKLKDKALGVAGDYQTFVEIGGKKYHHILDAKNGYPSPYNSMVMLLCNDSYTADLYDTAFFLMEPEKILDFVKTRNDMEVFIIDKSGKEYFSKNMKDYMEKISK